MTATAPRGFVPYNAGVQRTGGFVAGVSIGLVPFGSLVANALAGTFEAWAPVVIEGIRQGRPGASFQGGL